MGKEIKGQLNPVSHVLGRYIKICSPFKFQHHNREALQGRGLQFGKRVYNRHLFFYMFGYQGFNLFRGYSRVFGNDRHYREIHFRKHINTDPEKTCQGHYNDN